MPAISMFYGILIRMYNNGEHNPPHFHATYQGYNATFDMDGKLKDGEMPKKQRHLILAWVELHKERSLKTMKNPVWIVKDVQPKEDYTLLLTFADGTKKIYNARPLLEKAIYSPLKNPAFFLSAKAECGTVVWNDDVDIAPENLYECSEPVGGRADV